MNKTTNKGTVTDLDGNYTLEASAGDILHFSLIGCMSKNIKVTDPTHNVILRFSSAPRQAKPSSPR